MKYVCKWVAGSLVAAAMAGCLVDVEMEVEPGANWWDEVDPVEAERASLITYNLITYNLITYNSLSANVKSSELIVQHPLDDKTYSGGSEYLQWQLLDPGARFYMKYLVGCALDPRQSVTWKSPIGSYVETFDGSVGLCPEWGQKLPDARCQEVVSACILARNNAFGVPVALSMRGINTQDRPIFDPSALVSTADMGEKASFAPCTGFAMGDTRNCGFEGDMVGLCAGGSNVELKGTGCASGVAARVCAGREGCDYGDAAMLASTHEICGQTIGFTCPAAGEFSVMQGPLKTWVPEQATIVSAHGADYPATEERLFNTPEGAFFGNIFGGRVDRALNIEVRKFDGEFEIDFLYRDKPFGSREDVARIYTGTLFTDMYSCHSNAWSRGDAYLRQRVCAGVDHKGCAATPVGACYGPRRVLQLPWPSRRSIDLTQRRCAVDDNVILRGDGDYDDCQKAPGAPRWENPITVFLEHPCAATEDYDECYNRSTPWRENPKRPQETPRKDSGAL